MYATMCEYILSLLQNRNDYAQKYFCESFMNILAINVTKGIYSLLRTAGMPPSVRHRRALEWLQLTITRTFC